MEKRNNNKILSAVFGAPIGKLKQVIGKLRPQHPPHSEPPEQDTDTPADASRFDDDAEARALLSNPQQRDEYNRPQPDAPDLNQPPSEPQENEDESITLRRGRKRSKTSSGETETEPTGTSTKQQKTLTRFDRLLNNLFRFTPQLVRQKSKTVEADLYQDLELTLDDVVKGCQKEVVINFSEVCGDCKGIGEENLKKVGRCSQCRGAGTIEMKQGDYMVKQHCPQCDGKGRESAGQCATCDGNGTIERQHLITIDLPPGIQEGTKLKVPKEGNLGLKGGKKGDLYLTVQLTPHPYFVREDDDLHCQVEIDFVQAILGTTIKVPTLSGPVGLKVPAGVQPNQLLRIRGKGVPRYDGEGVGDVYVKLGVSLPTEITPRQREQLRQFYLDNGS